jgi:hypothetical protein
MENNMGENMKQKLVAKLIYTLYKRLPKSDTMTKSTHENKFSIQVKQNSINNHVSEGFMFNSGVYYGWVPKGINLPKVELKNFDGT